MSPVTLAHLRFPEIHLMYVCVCMCACVCVYSVCLCVCVCVCVRVYLPKNKDLVPTSYIQIVDAPPNVDVRGLGR